MIFEKVAELMKTFPKGTRLLGLDVGKKNIGIAISDPGLNLKPLFINYEKFYNLVIPSTA